MKWEYSYVYCGSISAPGVVNDYIRKGDEDWEMVGFDSKGYTWFKRPIGSENEVSRLKRKLIETEEKLNRIQKQLEKLESTM